MKLIHTCNFDGDYPDQKLVTELPFLDKESLQVIADKINELSGRVPSRYYLVVEDDYVLQGGFEP